MRPFGLVLAALLSLLLGAAEGRQERARPNVVFVLGDDWGWGDLGCYGSDRIKTPNLDRLAREGTLFTQYYVNGSVCSPTRAALMTGRFPARLAMHGHLAEPALNAQRAMPDFLDPAVRTLPRALKEAGYATGHFGKWHLGYAPGRQQPADYGFTAWRTIDAPDWNIRQPANRSRSSEEIVNETIRFIEAHRNEPFYVNTWLMDTHATLNPTEEQLAPYARFNPQGVPHKAAIAIYAAAATDADRHVGRLLQRLDDLGLARNTIVIFSADNGPEEIAIANASHSGVGSAGPFRGRKRSLYEGGVRTPFIVRWPGVTPAGRVDDTSVLSGADFMPTFTRIAGARAPAAETLDGVDMAPALRGERFERQKPLMWEWRFRIAGPVHNRSPILSIRDGKWKLLLNPDRSRVELYDIPADPMELDNQAARQPQVVERMAAPVLAWQKTLPPGPLDPGAGSNAYPWPKRVSK